MSPTSDSVDKDHYSSASDTSDQDSKHVPSTSSNTTPSQRPPVVESNIAFSSPELPPSETAVPSQHPAITILPPDYTSAPTSGHNRVLPHMDTLTHSSLDQPRQTWNTNQSQEFINSSNTPTARRSRKYSLRSQLFAKNIVQQNPGDAPIELQQTPYSVSNFGPNHSGKCFILEIALKTTN